VDRQTHGKGIHKSDDKGKYKRVDRNKGGKGSQGRATEVGTSKKERPGEWERGLGSGGGKGKVGGNINAAAEAGGENAERRGGEFWQKRNGIRKSKRPSSDATSVYTPAPPIRSPF